MITGIGCVSPFGNGLNAFINGLHEGRDTEEPKTFSTENYRIHGVYHAETPDIRPGARDFPHALALQALTEAMDDADVERGRFPECGLALASTSAGWHLPGESLDPGRLSTAAEDDAVLLLKQGPGLVLAEEWRLDGPHCTTSSACAASTGAVAWAMERIRRQETPLMAVGAVDVLTEVVFAGFHSMRLLSPTTTRPFASRRSGFVLAEGAAFVILEEAEHARKRGATALAALTGWGGSSDASHLTTPSADGIARSLRAALTDGGRAAEDIRVYHAHGTASAASDIAEADAVAKTLAPAGGSLRATAIKGMCGHTEGAAGLFSVIAAVECARRDRLPPLRDADQMDPRCAVLSSATNEQSNSSALPALVHASGFGGANCTVLVDRPDVRQLESRPGARVVIRLAAQADSVHGVRTTLFAPAAEPSTPPRVSPWERTVAPDRVTELLAEATGAALGSVTLDLAERIRGGGLLTGTAFGGQAHHARMHAALGKARGRGVDPLDFARSTFNVPASQCSIAYGIQGRVESYIGGSAGVEALLSAIDLVAAGRCDALLAAGYDAPENRLWRMATEPAVPAAATVLLVEAESAAGAPAIEVAGHRRLAPTTRQRTATALHAAVLALDESDPVEEIWLDASGLTPGQEESFLGIESRHCRVLRSLAGAASPLDQHVAAMARLLAGEARALTLVTTAPHAASAAIRYQRTLP
ncbi:beta-ketoacyl synthase N-terminal-like domain-containing protein [Streptomyces phyllanthi]|uniref:beta-ketoacyl synthase N-terminal-like domain-containing protein n=1 Tax=Streptomyces phyllanthi TaxID=1803180 RepID=UPI0036432507